MRLATCALIVGLCGCEPVAGASELIVQGTLCGPGQDCDVNVCTRDLDVDDASARGEWWPCDAWLTAAGCIRDEFHVNVFFGPPGAASVADLGGASCAEGVHEIFARAAEEGTDPVLDVDFTAFVLIGSDVDGDGAANQCDEDETFAASKLEAGPLPQLRIASIDPLGIRLEAQSDRGLAVVVDYRGPMVVKEAATPLEAPAACVEPP